jgi:hypothetical protein
MRQSISSSAQRAADGSIDVTFLKSSSTKAPATPSGGSGADKTTRRTVQNRGRRQTALLSRHKDRRDRAAELLKNRNPNSEVAVKDRQSGMMTVVLQARLMPTTQPVNGRYFGAKQW